MVDPSPVLLPIPTTVLPPVVSSSTSPKVASASVTWVTVPFASRNPTQPGAKLSANNVTSAAAPPPVPPAAQLVPLAAAPGSPAPLVMATLSMNTSAAQPASPPQTTSNCTDTPAATLAAFASAVKRRVKRVHTAGTAAIVSNTLIAPAPPPGSDSRAGNITSPAPAKVPHISQDTSMVSPAATEPAARPSILNAGA